MNTNSITEDADWFDALGVGDLVPPALAPWRGLVVSALGEFVRQLPQERRDEIVSAQLALGLFASPADRLVAFAACCPSLHKLGQVLARNERLDAQLRAALRVLESMPSSFSLPQLRSAIEHAIETSGEARPARLRMEPVALAEGSVATVIGFSWQVDGERREGVFKVLKPGIGARVREELALLPAMAAFLAREGEAQALPALDYADVLDSVRRALLREIDLRNEQHNLQAAAQLYAQEPRILVPSPLPWCSAEVTAMTRVHGREPHAGELAPAQRQQLAATMIDALLARPFFSRDEDAPFHGDLHGGNLRIEADGRLAVIDWSLTARLSRVQRAALLRIVLGAVRMDASRVCAAVGLLGRIEPQSAVLQAQVEAALDRIAAGAAMPGFDWALSLLDAVALRIPTGFDENLTLLRKTWLSLSGVLAELVGHASADAALLRGGLQQLAAEWPQRLRAPSTDADFAIPLSNAELGELAATTGFAWMRLISRRQRLLLFGAAAQFAK